MSQPFPYTSLACRWGEHHTCEAGGHTPCCDVYCVMHCACNHHYHKDRTKKTDETPSDNKLVGTDRPPLAAPRQTPKGAE